MPTEFTIEDRSFNSKSDVALIKKTTTGTIDESKLKIAFAALLSEYAKIDNNNIISNINMKLANNTRYD